MSATSEVLPQAQPVKRTSVVSGAGWLGAGAAAVKTAQTVVLLVLAALLAPTAIGVLAIAGLVLNVTSAITDLGTSTALVHWRGDATRAARSALTIALGFAGAITAIVWVLAPSLSALLQTGALGTDIIRGLMLCLPFMAVAGVSQELLRRSLAFRRRVVPDIIGAVAGAVLSVTMASNGHGAFSLVYGQLLQVVVVMVLCWLMVAPVRPGWSLRDARGLLSYGGHLAGANIVTLLMLNVDYLIVAHALGAADVGVYSMAFRLAYMPYLLVAMVIGGAAFAHLCRMQGKALTDAVLDMAAATARLTAPLYVGMIVLAPHLELLGEQWADGVPALRWLGVYGLLLTGVRLWIVALNATGRTRDSFLINMAHLVVLVILLFGAVAQGVTAVAVAQAGAAALALVLAHQVARRRLTDLSWTALVRRLTPTSVALGGMVIALLAAESLWPSPSPSVLRLLVVGSVGMAAYAAPLFLLHRRQLPR